MKKIFILRKIRLTLFISWMAAVIISCGQKKLTTRDLETTLKSIAPDSATAFEKLEDEILFRTADSVQLLDEAKVIFDSVIVFGDTIRWRIEKRTITANQDLKEFQTDSLIELYNAKSIYIEDNRQDWYELSDTRVKQTVSQTVVLIDKNKVKKQPNGKYIVRARAFSEAKHLCSAERFSSQPAAGFCSGFAVGKRIIATAGHCATTKLDLQNFYILFNFRQETRGLAVMEFDASEVYTGVDIIKQQLDSSDKIDFALIRVDHDIPNNRIAKIRATDVRLTEPVFVIGYPCGLPVKFADGARVIDNNQNNFFLADLDTFGGNSGSPVYDTAHMVVGILVRGIRDFSHNEALNCNFSYICQTPGSSGCEGEGISRTAQFMPFIEKQELVSILPVGLNQPQYANK